jgi:hypothetical protein
MAGLLRRYLTFASAQFIEREFPGRGRLHPAKFYRYTKSAQNGKMLAGDEQVPGTPSAYGDFMTLFPTYSYFRAYSVQAWRHTGEAYGSPLLRNQRHVMSLCLGFEGESRGRFG